MQGAWVSRRPRLVLTRRTSKSKMGPARQEHVRNRTGKRGERKRVKSGIYRPTLGQRSVDMTLSGLMYCC